MKTFTTSTFAALITCSLLLSARADITTGLVGYWSLSDGPGHSTVTDLSGNGNTGTLKNFSDGTYNNMWTASSDPRNGWPYAMLFNQSGEGTATYISIPDAPSLDLPSTGTIQWTISAWVNCSVAGGSEPANAGIVTKGVISGTAYEYCLYMTGGKFACAFRNNPNSGGEVATSVTVPAANTWYHVVGVCHIPRITVAPSTQGSEVWIYVNGVQEYGTNSNTYTTMLTNTTAVTIGCFGAGINPFQGTVDEVRFYNRELTASDVLQLYNNQAFTLLNNGIGFWNGLAGSGGNATLDTTSLNFTTNLASAPLGTPANLPSVFTVENANTIQPSIIFEDGYYSNNVLEAVASTNISVATGGVAVGNANGAGTMKFLNAAVTYTVNSSDSIGIKDGANPTSLVESGPGLTILTGTNTFSGGTTISGGILQLGNGGASGSPLGSGAVTDNASLVFDGNDNPTFANTISAGGTVTQAGTGTLTLISASSSYSGGTTITNGGSLSVNSMNDSGCPIGTGPVNLSGGTIFYTSAGNETTLRTFNGAAGKTNTIDVPGGITLELDGQVKSTAAWVINKTDTGTLTLGGSTTDNTFLGMNVNAGTLILIKTGATGHAIDNPLTVSSGAVLQMGNAGYSYQITNSVVAPVTINSGGVLDVNGQTEIFAILNLSGAGIGGIGAVTNSSTSPATLTVPTINLAAATTIGGGGNITLAGTISGSGSLTYAGTASSVLTLQGYNTYSGGTFVNSGTLDGNTADSIPGNVAVASGATNELDNNFAMSPTSTLTLASGAVCFLNFSSATQTVAGLVIGGIAQPAGTYGAVGSGATFTSASFAGSGILNVLAQYWDANHAFSANGGGTGSWDNSASDWWVSGGSDTMWASGNVAYFAGTAGTVTLNAPETVIGMVFNTAGYFVTNSDGTSALTLSGNNPIISISTGTTAVGCDITGGGTAVGLTASGPGSLILAGTNNYTGGTLITNGATLSVPTINESGNNALGAGGVTVYGGTLAYTGPGDTTGRNITGVNPGPNGINVPAGNLTVNGSVSGTNWIKSGSGTLYLGGTVDNPSLGMAINGGEVIITKTSATSAHGLGGASSSVASGAELQLAGLGGFDLYKDCILTINSGGLLDLNGQSDIFSTLTLSGTGFGSGALINSSSTPSVITNNGSGVILAADTTIGGVGNISEGGVVSGTAVLTYAGTATLALSGANTYSGGTIINPGGTVLLTNSTSSGGTGPITDNGTLAVGVVGANAILANSIFGPGIINMMETAGDNVQLGGVMSGFTGTINCPATPGTSAKTQILTTTVALPASATINVANGGTFYVANTNVIIPCPINLYGVGNTENYGALRIETGALISGPVILYGSTTMGNGQSAANRFATISGPISETNGSFGIAFGNEPGTIFLNGTNSFTGPITISNGVIAVGGSGCLGVTALATNYAGNITNNAYFVYNSSAAQILSGSISGTGILGQSGPGALTLTATNSYTNNTWISNSTLAIGGSGCLGVTALTTNYPGNITNVGGVLAYSSSAAQTLSGLISGSGTLTENGPGQLTLSMGDIYTGGTVVNAGTLALAAGGSINSTASIGIAAGATYDVSVYSSYTVPVGTALNASGTGTTVGTTAATIKGGPGSSPVTVDGPVILGYTPQAFTGDATHPSFYVSQGALTFAASSLTVSNASATPLGSGTYSLIQVASASILNSVSSVTVTGTGLAAGATASISVSGGSVNMVVTNTFVPTPVINSVGLSGGALVFSGTNGPDSGNFYVLTSTNIALPLSNWTVLSTNSFSPTGTFTVTNTNTPSPSYFIIAVP